MVGLESLPQNKIIKRNICMSAPSFFTPVYGRSLLSLPDWYFDLGLTKQAYVLTGETKDGKHEVKLYKSSPSYVLTALKVLSYTTFVIPLIMLALKIVVRALSSYVIESISAKARDLNPFTSIWNGSGTTVWGFSISEKYGVMVNGDAKKTTLLAFKEATSGQKQKLINENGVARTIEEMEETLSKIPSYFLELLTLEDVIIPYEYSPLKFAELSNENFSKLTCEELSGKKVTPEQFALILKRSKLVLNFSPKIDENPAKWRLVDLDKIDASIIAKNLNKIGPLVFAFLENNQLKGIKLSDLSQKQANYLFKFLKEEELAPRLALFEDVDVAQAVNDQKLLGEALKLLSDKQILLLKLSNLSKEQISHLFPNSYDVNADKETKRRFGLIKNIEEIQTAIKNGTLSTSFQFQLLSDKQLSELNFSALTYSQISDLFSNPHDPDKKAKEKERFKHLRLEEVQTALNQEKLCSSYLASLLSDKHIESLKLSGISRKQLESLFSNPYDTEKEALQKRRFSLLAPNEVQGAIVAEKLDTYQLRLLSDLHLKALELSSISKSNLVRLFFNPYDKDKEILQKQRFSLLTSQSVQNAIDAEKLDAYQLQLLSDQHLKALNLSIISKSCLETLFSNPFDSEKKVKEKKRFSLLQPSELKIAIEQDKLTKYQYGLLSESQLKFLNGFTACKERIEKYCTKN